MQAKRKYLPKKYYANVTCLKHLQRNV